jgi:predicted deacetylase
MHPGERPRAHISIHDVAPDTLDRVRKMLSRLKKAGVTQVMLLVIPGLEWTEESLAQLRDWQGQGHPLAGHGWVHRVERRNTLFHKVHGMLISRYVAEHLSLGNGEILDLMRRCYDWFGENGLPGIMFPLPGGWVR